MYLLKDSVEDGLIQAIHHVSRGRAFFSPAVARILGSQVVRDPKVREIDDLCDSLT